MIVVILFVILGAANGLGNDGFVGCYRDNAGANIVSIEGYNTVDECRAICQKKYYRYAMIRNENICYCGNFLGTKYNARSCMEVCQMCSENVTDVYLTGVEVPGPPRDFKIYNITNSTAYVSWKEPDSFVDIQSYKIKAKAIRTYSTFSSISREHWIFSNNTFNTELNFQPGTRYNVTLQAVSKHGEGTIASQIIETLIGFPDNIPSTPIILKREGKVMVVQLYPVMNNNGPITAYRIVVINEDTNQATLQTDHLRSYKQAMDEGYSYYIAADISPQDIDKNFTVGDGLTYGGYFNAPLEPETNYQVLLGVVSRYKNITNVVYGNSTELTPGITVVNILPAPEPEEETPGVIIGLSVAIGLLSCLLIAGIIGFFILTRRISNRRRRLTDNQELTMQGPIIEVENTGYVPEDEITPTNHYDNLKQQLWNIPQTLIKIEPTNSLGSGKYGRLNSGTVRKDNNFVPVAIYTIYDRKLGHENKRAMLKDLDLLIRCGKQDNILSLVGTCETPETLFVVLEYASMNLKDLLLGSRDALPGRFSNMQESQALDIAIGVANGMKHLESLRITHKQLCARNILITNGFVPKVSGYGLAQYCNPNMVPDYTRWTAAEVFRSQQYVSKCDVWSFACLLWEICVLGGTPYSSVPNNEIPEKVMRGLRLMQLRYISDDLYQLMLNCWQLDLDERPTFKDLVQALQDIKDDTLNVHLNFNLYPEFQYEQFYPNMELAARTIY